MCVCKEDWVYLPEEAERQEYVMAEQGIIYTGTRHYIGARDWNYGQVYIHLMSLGFMLGSVPTTLYVVLMCLWMLSLFVSV